MKLCTFATTAIALIATAVLGFAAPFVTAQTIHPVVAQSSSPAPTPSFSDTELRVFAVAVVGVQRVTDTYLPVLKRSTTIQDQQRVEDAASAEMARVVENQGMTVSRFSQILELTKVSPELANRVRWHIQQSTAVAYRGD
jgi:Domain of unknown function (DUF4168)